MTPLAADGCENSESGDDGDEPCKAFASDRLGDLFITQTVPLCWFLAYPRNFAKTAKTAISARSTAKRLPPTVWAISLLKWCPLRRLWFILDLFSLPRIPIPS